MHPIQDPSYTSEHQYTTLLASQADYLIWLSSQMHTAANDFTYAAYTLRDRSVLMRKGIFDKTHRSTWLKTKFESMTASDYEKEGIRNIVKESCKAGLMIRTGNDMLAAIEKAVAVIKERKYKTTSTRETNVNVRVETEQIDVDPTEFIMDTAAKIVARNLQADPSISSDSLHERAYRVTQNKPQDDIGDQLESSKPACFITDNEVDDSSSDGHLAEQEIIPENKHDYQSSETEFVIQTPLPSPLLQTSSEGLEWIPDKIQVPESDTIWRGGFELT